MLQETKEKITKGIHEDVIAENFDNTASYKAIIASVDSKKKRQKTLTNYLTWTVRRKNRPNRFFCFSDFLYPSHPRNKFSEEWDGGLNSGFFEEFPLKSVRPYMITKVQNCGKADPVTEVLEKTHKWCSQWSKFQVANTKIKNKTVHKWFDDNVLYCPKMYIEMAEHLVDKPDQFLEDVYNWYYAGNGNFVVANLDGSDYIIHSVFNCVYVSPFYTDNLSIDYANTTTYKCAEGANIMETIHAQNVIALRTKFKVIILKIVKSESTLTLERLKEMTSELPFTSITFDEFHKNILYVTTLDYQLTIVNIDRMTKHSKKLRGKFPSLTDNWSSVISAERGHYAHITKKTITLYDKRNNEPFQRWRSFKMVSDVGYCVKISAAKYCQEKPLLYVATNHNLFLMDMRCGKTKDDNISAVQRWTHGMISPPTYLNIHNYDRNSNREMVCLSSQWFEDMCVVNNYSDRLTRIGEINGLTFPFRPPSIMQTFNDAQMKRLCDSIDAPIRHRLYTAVTGLATVDQDDSFSILMHNSLGDVSCHAMYPKHMVAFIVDDSPERLHEWSKDYREEKKPFEISHLIDIQVFLRNLPQIPDRFILGRNNVIKPRLKFNENEIYETYRKEDIDPEFLDIWKEKDAETELDEDSMNQFFVSS